LREFNNALAMQAESQKMRKRRNLARQPDSNNLILGLPFLISFFIFHSHCLAKRQTPDFFFHSFLPLSTNRELLICSLLQTIEQNESLRCEDS